MYTQIQVVQLYKPLIASRNTTNSCMDCHPQLVMKITLDEGAHPQIKKKKSTYKFKI